MIAVLVIVFVVGVFVVMVARERGDLVNKKGKYPEGHFVALGLVFGICVGLPFGVLVGNVALGPSVGLAIGLLVGAMVEDKYRSLGRMRILTKRERGKEVGLLKFILIMVLSILVIVSAFVFILGIN